MSLTARHDKAALILEKIKERLKQDVMFNSNSTTFHMGIQQERRDILTMIQHYEDGK